MCITLYSNLTILILFFYKRKSKNSLVAIILHVTMFETEIHRSLHRIYYLYSRVLSEIIHNRIMNNVKNTINRI